MTRIKNMSYSSTLSAHILVILHLSLLFTLVRAAADGLTSSEAKERQVDKHVKKSNDLTMKWSELGLKAICHEEEWLAQFKTVRGPFTRCLGLKAIDVDRVLTDDDGKDNHVYRYSAPGSLDDSSTNPYCRIAETWDSCWHFLEGLTCIEPNYNSIARKLPADGLFGLMDEFDLEMTNDVNTETLAAMGKAYERNCKMAQMANNYGSLGADFPYWPQDYDGELPPDPARHEIP